MKLWELPRLAAALLALALSGCGFSPLYATSTGVTPELAAIVVEAPGTRIGQLLREELDDELAVDRTSPARYRLVLRLEERRFSRGLRIDDTANRYELRLIVRYRLLDASSRRMIVASRQPVFVTYDVADAPYAGIAAAEDGQARAANEAARLIRTDLARAFARLSPSRLPPVVRTETAP